MTYIRETQESNGDLTDIHYFCSYGCWRDSFADDRMGPATAPEGGHPAYCDAGSPDDDSFAGLTSGGSYDGSMPDYDVYCAECGVLMHSLERETPSVVNLITRPPIDPMTGEAEIQNV